MGLLSRIRGKRSARRNLHSRRLLHLPDDLRDPRVLAVLSGRRREDIWAPLFLMNTLQKHFPDNTHVLVCREADTELAGVLRWMPETIGYDGTPSSAADRARELMGEGGILFHPYPVMDSESAAFIASSGVPVCVSTATDPVANITVRVGEGRQPERLYRMCEILGITPERDWNPAVPDSFVSGAASILAPVSGRALPYIAATTAAAAILEKRRAEIPVRMVIVEGKRSEIPEITRGIMAAIVGGASAVATTDPGLWLKAHALKVPVVGLDLNGRFPDWGDKPAADEGGFLAGWTELLRRGW
jgi:hypothetical protein